MEQYKKDRNPREKLFGFGRCVSHFAVDENEVHFCTHLKGKASWFLPFNRGWNDGAGNPPKPNGLRSDYLWRQVLTRRSLTNILENYAQIVESKDTKTGKKRRVQIWPRYHQLDAVRRTPGRLQAAHGAGKRYLIQHSAGSGKSLFDRLGGPSTDPDGKGRRSSLRLHHRRHRSPHPRHGRSETRSGNTLRCARRWGTPSVRATCDGSSSPARRSSSRRSRSSLSFSTRSATNIAGAALPSSSTRPIRARAAAPPQPWPKRWARQAKPAEEETYEDQINCLMESRKLLPNASYFAFTATPKNKTLEIFGDADPQSDETVQHHAFHTYSMKQAIQEGFILDVLRHYTPVKSYYKLAKTVEDDPKFDVEEGLARKLRRYVEGHDHAIRLKSEIMVDHFHTQVLSHGKIGGKARAMVVTNGIKRAIQYFHAIREYLKERKSRYQAIVAFSGEHEYGGAKVSEPTLNGFPSNRIAEKFQEDPYRFLVCADKFQTGYDEPLLHTMYVDKTLSGIRAVQTLSRLNRAHPKKHDVFILDFLNESDTISDAFADYYRATILSEETDPNKLHDLQADLDAAQVYSPEQIKDFVSRYLADADRDELDPILDACVAVYLQDLDEDGQVQFKRQAKGFLRTYAFLSSLLPYNNAEWEERSIFLNFLVSKLPSPARGGSVQGHPRRHRHGQLPGRETGDSEDPPAG